RGQLRLVRVRRRRSVLFGHEEEDLVLERVGVLELVDEDRAEARSEIAAHGDDPREKVPRQTQERLVRYEAAREQALAGPPGAARRRLDQSGHGLLVDAREDLDEAPRPLLQGLGLRRLRGAERLSGRRIPREVRLERQRREDRGHLARAAVEEG